MSQYDGGRQAALNISNQILANLQTNQSPNLWIRGYKPCGDSEINQSSGSQPLESFG